MASRVISAVLKFKDQNFSKGIKDANKKAGDFGRHMQKAQNKVEQFNKKAAESFKKIGVAAGALAVGGVAALSVAVTGTVKEMETAFNKLEAQTGATGIELEKFKSIAQQVFVKGLSDSIAEASDSVAKIKNMFGDISTAELQNITTGSLGIAKAFNQEGTEVARAIKAMTTNFKELSGTDAADLITVAFQKTGDFANDVLDTFSEYSGYFKDVGMSGEQFTSMLIKGAETGAWNIDKIGDAVKEFSIRSIDGSKASAEGFAAIGLKATDMGKKIAAGGETAHQAYMATVTGLAAMKDPIKQNEAGVALFGTMWEDLRKDVVFAMSDSTSAVTGFEGATERAINSMTKGPIANMKKGWRELTTGIADMVATNPDIQETLNGISSGMSNAVPKIESIIEKGIEFGTMIKDNWGPIKETVIGITVAVVTFKGAMTTMTIVSTVTGFLNAYRKAVVAGTGATFLFNNVLKANPIGLVVTLVTALITAGVLLYRNWDTAAKKMDGAWNFIKKSAAGAVNFVIDGINAMIKTINLIPGVNIPLIAKVDWGSAEPPKGMALASEKAKSHSKASATTGLASFAVGTNRVTHDQTANIHKDEMIIPKSQAAKVRSLGGNINNISDLITSGMQKRQMPNGQTQYTFTFGNIIIQTEGKGEKFSVEQFIEEVKRQLKVVLG